MDNSSTTNCSSSYRNEFIYVAVVGAVVAFIALLACLFAIFIVILFKKWKFFSQRLIFYLIIASLLTSVSTLIHGVDNNNTGFCIFAGFFGQITAWMTFNGVTAVTVYLFALAVFDKYTEKYEVLYALYIFVFPLTYCWIPFINNSYGKAGVWCWIRTFNPDCTPFLFGQTLQLVVFYIPIFTLLVVLIILYLVIIWKLQSNIKKWVGTYNRESDNIYKKQRSEILSLMIYPLIYFVLYIPLVLNRIYGWAAHEPFIVLWYLSAISHPLQGGIVVLAFTLDSHTRRRLNWAHVKSALKRYIGSKAIITDYKLGEDVTEEEVHEDAHYRKFEEDIYSDEPEHEEES